MDHISTTKRRHKPIQPPSPCSEDDGRKASVFRRLGTSAHPREIHHPKPHHIPTSRPVCRHWQARGQCDFGNECSFSHPPMPPPAAIHSSPKKYVRNQSRTSQEFLSPQDSGRIRSAVVVSKSESRTSRKVTLPEDDPDISRTSNYEFESALALERERQFLQRRIDELNEIVPEKREKQTSHSRKHELREDTPPAHQPYIGGTQDSDMVPKGYHQDHRSPYRNQSKMVLKSVGFPANRQFPPNFTSQMLRRRRRHLDNKEEGELSDDPEKREARREKNLLLQKSPSTSRIEEIKETKKRPPKTPPETEMEPPRQNFRSKPSERLKASSEQEIPINRPRSPSERRGVKRQHYEMIRDDGVEEKRQKIVDPQLMHRRRGLPPRSSPLVVEEQTRHADSFIKPVHDRRDHLKQGTMRQPGMKRDHHLQDHFRRKYEQYSGQRRFPAGLQGDMHRKMPTRHFEKRPLDVPDARRRKEFRPLTPPMVLIHDRGWKKSPAMRDAQARHPIDRRHVQPSPAKSHSSPIKVRQMEEERFENRFQKSPIMEFSAQQDQIVSRKRRHHKKEGRSKERSYTAIEKAPKSTRKIDSERRNSSTPIENEKFSSSLPSSSPKKFIENTCESIVEKIVTPENDDEEINEKITDDMNADQDFEPISDEEVQEECDKVTGAAEAVDWTSLAKTENVDDETKFTKNDEFSTNSIDKFKPENFLSNLGLQKDLLGPELAEKIENLVNSLKRTGSAETEFRLRNGADLNRSKLSSVQRRLQILNDVGPYRKALCARVDLKLRRQLCGLYAEPYENLHTTEFNVPFNADAFAIAKNLFLKKRPDSQAV